MKKTALKIKQTIKKYAAGMAFLCIAGSGACTCAASGNEGNADAVSGSGAEVRSIADPASFAQEEASFESWQETLPENLNDVTAPSIRGVQVKRGGETVFAVSYEDRIYKNSFDCWAISEPYKSWAYADTEALYGYFEQIASIELTAADGTGKDVEEDAVWEEGTSVYVAYYSQQGSDAGQAEPDAGIRYQIGPKDEAGHYYVRTEAGLWYADCEAVDALLDVEPYDYILKVANVVGVLTVSAVDIETEEGQLHMELGDEYRIGAKNVEKEEAYELYTELISVFIESELPKDTPDGPWEKLLEITYHRNLEVAPEITETFYAYDEEHALLEINGYAFFLVSREDVEKLAERCRSFQ